MSNVKTATNLTSSNARVGRSYKPESRVVLFGNEQDHDVVHSRKALEKVGREVAVVSRPGFDTGTGMCGNHLCHCKEICKAQYI